MARVFDKLVIKIYWTTYYITLSDGKILVLIDVFALFIALKKIITYKSRMIKFTKLNIA